MGENDTRDCPRCMAHTLHYTGGTVVEDDDDWGYRLYYHEMKCGWDPLQKRTVLIYIRKTRQICQRRPSSGGRLFYR